jgi:hypothetical protein
MANEAARAFATSASKEMEPSLEKKVEAGIRELAHEGRTDIIKAAFGGDEGTLRALIRTADIDGGTTSLSDNFSSAHTLDAVKGLKNSQFDATFLMAALGGAHRAAELMISKDNAAIGLAGAKDLRSAIPRLIAMSDTVTEVSELGTPRATRELSERLQREKEWFAREEATKHGHNGATAQAPEASASAGKAPAAVRTPAAA